VRSRNGNRPVLYTGIALISTLCFGADHYYVGYRLTTQNSLPVHETFDISKAMRPCDGSLSRELVLLRRTQEPLKEVLERGKSTFVEYALSETGRIKSDTRSSQAQIRTQETLTLPTRCYAVEFNDESVTIALIK